MSSSHSLCLSVENGVRRVDVLEILKEVLESIHTFYSEFINGSCYCCRSTQWHCALYIISELFVCLFNSQSGIEDSEHLDAVKSFIEAGRGKALDSKRRSGCQLQEVIELFERLLMGSEKDRVVDSKAIEEKLLDTLKSHTKAAVRIIKSYKASVVLLNFLLFFLSNRPNFCFQLNPNCPP